MQKSIQTTAPPRLAGQSSVVALKVPPMPVVRVGIVGLGERGQKAVERFLKIEHAEIAALCDVSEERVQAVAENLPHTPTIFTRHRDLCHAENIDLIYICTDWVSHVPIALEAMNSGKHVAIEVPAAMTLADCWALVDTAERTQRHCIMLENCCYDSRHLSVMEAVKKGDFGTVVHVEGAYIHPIGDRWTPWRVEANQKLRGDLYPTHGMGPACQLLDIHRTDRLGTLVSMDTNAFQRDNFRNGRMRPCLYRTIQR